MDKVDKKVLAVWTILFSACVSFWVGVVLIGLRIYKMKGWL